MDTQDSNANLQSKMYPEQESQPLVAKEPETMYGTQLYNPNFVSKILSQENMPGIKIKASDIWK